MNKPTMTKIAGWGLGCLLGFLLIVALVSVPLAQDIVHLILKGNNWRDMKDVERHAYTIGFLDGVQTGFATERTGGESLKWISDCLVGKRTDQMQAIIQKQMDEHPENWDHPMAELTLNALALSCPNSGWNVQRKLEKKG